MKDCTRLDIMATNTIKLDEKMASVVNKKPKPRVVSSAGNSLVQKLGSEWKSSGTSAILRTEVGGVSGLIKVKQDDKSQQYKFQIEFGTSACQKKTDFDLTKLKQNISDTLVSVVKTTADLGNKLG